MAHLIEIGLRRQVDGGIGSDLARRVGERLKDIENGVRKVFGDLALPISALTQGEAVECLRRCPARRLQVRTKQKQLKRMITPIPVVGENVGALVQKIEFTARQVERLAQIDFQKILGYRQRALQIRLAKPGRWSECPSEACHL